jgi:putative DNA primase/helicase
MNIHHPPAGEAFRAAIFDALGAAPSQIIGDGKAHRFSVNGKKRDDAGEYRFYDDAFAAGYAKDYRSGLYFTWSARGETAVLSESDRAERDRIIRDREERRQREQAEATRLANQLWQGAKPANPAHPYLALKNVRAHGLRQDGDKLLVPVIDGGELISVQTIAPDGHKLFPLNTRVKGGSFTIGDETDVIYVVEGYATGATIHELTGQQTIVAFNSGNLLAVAPKIRASNYQAHIMIIGDDDFTVNGNPGVRDATKAAKSINAYMAVPPFDRDAGEVGTDFNDLSALHGSRPVQGAIYAAFDAGPLGGEGEQEAKKERNVYDPPGERAPPPGQKFTLEPFEQITLATGGEWLVKKLIPKAGTGVLLGASQSFKSFAAMDLGFHVSIGREWGGRRVTQAPVVYIAAEGAGGVRKRKVGFEKENPNLPAPVPFYLISAAPNFGVGQEDQRALIASVNAVGVKPGLIIIDTLAQTLGGGDENGGGMLQFVANATALANHFGAFVLVVHHIGLTAEDRERGHSSLIGGADVRILCQRKVQELAATLKWLKLKDEDTNVTLKAHLARIVIGQDEDGDDISTLIVESIEEGVEGESGKQAKSIPRAQRLLMDMVAVALNEAGAPFRPFGTDGPLVRAVADGAVRERYYARIAETPKQDDTPKKLADRQRQAFCASIKSAIDAKMLVAARSNGERVLWLP